MPDPAPRLLRQPAVIWLIAAALAAYILYATIDWDVPAPGGPSFGPLWIVGTVVAVIAVAIVRRSVTPLGTIVAGALVAMVLTDVAYLGTQPLRDLSIYVRAGERFLGDQPVYLDTLVTARPEDLANYPFLYPPMTLPFFGTLSLAPRPIVDAAWVVGSLAAAIATLRVLGLGWRWSFALLVWPPFFQGIQVGNVAVPLGLLFVLGLRYGPALVIGAIFKIYSGLAALWLVRERRWGDIAVGIAIVVGLGLVTLPLTGIARWFDWLAGLGWFRASQPLLPDSLYGFGLQRYLPAGAAIVIAIAVVAWALKGSGRTGLARLGMATAIASPSLYSHGLIVGLPALLDLRGVALWTALALTSVAPGAGWWLAIGLVLASWALPGLRRDAVTGSIDELALHPIAPDQHVWQRVVGLTSTRTDATLRDLTNVR